MGRANYSDDYENVALWRNAVKSAMYGRRGQTLLRNMLAALDSLEVKELIPEKLVDASGQFCALGALGAAYKIDMAEIDPEDFHTISKTFNAAEALIREIEYMNDEVGPQGETPNRRWHRMRAWVAKHILPT